MKCSLIAFIYLFILYTANAQCISPADCDGDGIPNELDLDDDNDGIPDLAEDCGGYLLQRPGAWKGATASTLIRTGGNFYNYSSVFPPSSTNDGQSYYFFDGLMGSDRSAYVNGNFTHIYTFSPAVPVNEIAIWLNDVDSYTPTFTLTINDGMPPGDAFFPMAMTLAGAVNLMPYDGTTGKISKVTSISDYYIMLKGRGSTLISNIKITSSGMGAGDWINCHLFALKTCDSDGDGIPDYQDLDSDNDGCPDAFEGSASFTVSDLTNEYRLKGDVASNGIPLSAGAGQGIGSSKDATISFCKPAAIPDIQQVGGKPRLIVLSDQPLQGEDSTTGGGRRNWATDSLIITSLPTDGYILKYNGADVIAGQKIDNYDPILLTIEPGPATPASSTGTTFAFAVLGATGAQSEPATFAITFGDALPIDFGFIIARLEGDKLVVDWSSISETNNSHFEIEISRDGKHFVSIGKVNSKAESGNSSTALSYSFSAGLSGALAGFSLLFAALLIPCFRKYKYICTIVMLLGIGAFQFSCSKQNKDALDSSGKSYVRVVQVDKDGTKHYSKVVQTIIE